MDLRAILRQCTSHCRTEEPGGTSNKNAHTVNRQVE